MTDRSAEVRPVRDWTAFSRLESLANHWDRPAWPEGAQAYYWLLPLGAEPELRTRTRACQEALVSVPDLDAVPGDLLHLTLYRIGAVDAIADEQLAAIAAAAAARLESVNPVHLSIGPLAGSSGAIRYSVTPWDQLGAVRDELVRATEDVLGGDLRKGWRPHVSIAYNARARAAAPIVARVRELRHLPPIGLTATGFELVKLTRLGRMYRWTTLHRLTLVARSGTAD